MSELAYCISKKGLLIFVVRRVSWTLVWLTLLTKSSQGSESVLFSTRSLSEKWSYFLAVQNAPGLHFEHTSSIAFDIP